MQESSLNEFKQKLVDLLNEYNLQFAVFAQGKVTGYLSPIIDFIPSSHQVTIDFQEIKQQST